MQKIVINRQHGAFGLSQAALQRFAEITGRGTAASGETLWSLPTIGGVEFDVDSIPRDHAALVQVVEELGPAANDWGAELAIVEVPDDVQWQIHEHAGREWVAERHRTWE